MNDLQHIFVHTLVAVAQSSSGGVAIRYVLPVLWMTSCLSVLGSMTYFNTEVEFDLCKCLVLLMRNVLPKYDFQWPGVTSLSLYENKRHKKKKNHGKLFPKIRKTASADGSHDALCGDS